VRTFAIIEDGIVANVILADAWPNGIDVTDLTPRPGPGWSYDSETFSPPAPVEPVVQTTTRMTHLGFLSRMTADEWGRFEAFLASSVEARFAKALFDAARDVDTARPDVQQFANVLRMVGVLESDSRVADLLAPIPADSVHALP
jgi:hypothetical protein